MRASAFEVIGSVIEAMPNGTFRVELANGHKLLAFCKSRSKNNFAGTKPGDKVNLRLTPFDLSTGRLVIEKN